MKATTETETENLYEVREIRNWGELKKETYRIVYVKATSKQKAINQLSKRWGYSLYYDRTNYANVVITEWKRKEGKS